MMTSNANWRTGAKVIRAAEQERARLGPFGVARATGFEFARAGGIWLGTVAFQPNATSGAHHHGRNEVAYYVVRGSSQVRWGEKLEFAAEVRVGDFVHYAPFLPHQELNLDASETLDLVVIRTDDEYVRVGLDDIVPVAQPEMVY
jgi:uncharacterized RmlC-like cupin family protein